VPMVRGCLTEASLLLSIMASVAAVCIYGIASQSGKQPGRSALGDIWAGLYYAWMGNGYRCSWCLPCGSAFSPLPRVCGSAASPLVWFSRLPSPSLPPFLPLLPLPCLYLCTSCVPAGGVCLCLSQSTMVDVLDLPPSLSLSPSLPPPPPLQRAQLGFFCSGGGQQWPGHHGHWVVDAHDRRACLPPFREI
jgi:hypothetical protein